jgi:hypothetical protein
MLTDILTLNDGVAAQAYTLVSREGMNSVRRKTTAGTLSSAMAELVIKHTLDNKAKTKPNRHLMSVTESEQDTAGNTQTATVHYVITRSKGVSDALVLKLAETLANALGDPAIVAQVLIGGN